MNSSAIYYALQDRLLILKLVGYVRAVSREASRLSAALEALVQGLPRRQDFDHVLIDLSETSSIDSTNLGLVNATWSSAL